MADKITAQDIIESKKTVEDILKVDAGFEKLLSTMAEVVKLSGSFKTQGQGNQVLQTRVKLETEASAAIKERARLQNALLRQEAKNSQVRTATSKNLAKERLETQILNRQQKESAILLSKYTGAYQKLNLQRTQASKTLRDLVVSEKASNAEIEKAQANFDKLDAKVKKADAAVKDSTKNVGNYKSAFKGVIGVVRGLVGAFGIIEGLRLGIQFGKDAIALARQAKGVEFAFKQLGEEGTKAFDDIKKATRGTLSDLDIKTSINDFKNLGIQLETSGTSFEFLAVRAAQTGRSVESLREDLVTGLGRGSVRILDNLGLSMAELNRLTKEQGLSIQEAFGVVAQKEIAKAGNILDEAANSSEKFSASFENLTLNIGIAFDQFKGSDSIVGIIESLSETQEALNANWESGGGFLKRLRIQANLYSESGREANRQLVIENNLRKENADAVQQQINQYVALNGSLAPLTGQAKQFSESFDLSGPVRDVIFLNKEIESLNEKLLETTTRDEAKSIQNTIDALEKEKESILGVQGSKKQTVNIIEGTIAAYERDIKVQKKFQQEEALTAKQIQESNFKILELQASIDKLTGVREKVLKLEIDLSGSTDELQKEFEKITKPFTEAGFTVGFGVESAIAELDKINEARQEDIARAEEAEETKTRIAQEQADRRAEILKGVFREFENQYGIDASAFSDLIDSKKNDFEDFGAAASEINDLIFNIASERRAADYENAKATLDRTLDDETKSEEQRAAAKAKFRKKEAEIKKKEFKAAKTAALISIAIQTATAVISALSAPPVGLGPVAGIPLAVVAGVFGAAQAAIVASKKPPQFFRGTQNAPEGWAWTDEKGAELHTDKRGRVKDSGSTGGARMKWLEAGDKIYPADQTRSIFQEQDLSQSILNKVIMRGHNERVAYKSEKVRKDDRLLNEVSQLRNDVQRLSTRPVNVENTVVIEKEISQY